MRKKYLGLLIIPFLVFAVSCGDPVPVKEMSRAKLALTDASNVKADKYSESKKDFYDAQNLMYQSNDFVKNDKMEEAKKAAEDAEKKAKDAYNKALPMVAKESLDIAKESLIQADDAYASEISPSEFMDAKNFFSSAEADYNKKNFDASYKAAIAADEKAKQAKNNALAGKGVFAEKINNIKFTISEAEKYDASKVAPDKVSEANKNLSEAETYFSSDKLKACNDRINIAKSAADEALKVAAKKRADEKIEEATAVVAKVEKSPKAKAAPDEMSGAKEMLLTAKNQYLATQYVESINSAEEAIKLAKNIVGGKVGEDTVVAVGDGSFEVYVVKYRRNGTDYLRKIAKKFYKDEAKWKLIYEANKETIKNPDIIYGGWKIKIPKIEGMVVPSDDEKKK